MAILWAGGEDIDFPLLGTATVITTAGNFRSGWARCGIRQSNLNAGGASAKSAPFNGGALTSAWLSWTAITSKVNSAIMPYFVGFGLSGTNKWLGVTYFNIARTSITKWDGTTATVLATESGASIAINTLQRFDMQVINYGASATVNVYVNGVAVVSFAGDVTVSGMTNFDTVAFPADTSSTSGNIVISEVFVSDVDTRNVQGLQTLALVGAGTTNAWTNNTFSNINGISFSDASPTSSNTTTQNQQYTVTTPTPVSYSVAAVSISARMAKSTTATPTQVKLGYGSGGTAFFGAGAAKTVALSYQTYEQIDAINPITGVAFTQSDIAALQLDLTSA